MQFLAAEVVGVPRLLLAAIPIPTLEANRDPNPQSTQPVEHNTVEAGNQQHKH